MPAIPESTRSSIILRLLDHAEHNWPELATVQARYRGPFAYITGVLPGGRPGASTAQPQRPPGTLSQSPVGPPGGPSAPPSARIGASERPCYVRGAQADTDEGRHTDPGQGWSPGPKLTGPGELVSLDLAILAEPLLRGQGSPGWCQRGEPARHRREPLAVTAGEANL